MDDKVWMICVLQECPGANIDRERYPHCDAEGVEEMKKRNKQTKTQGRADVEGKKHGGGRRWEEERKAGARQLWTAKDATEDIGRTTSDEKLSGMSPIKALDVCLLNNSLQHLVHLL